MAVRFIFVLVVMIVLAKGSHISPVEPESPLETHSAGGVTSQGAVSFPEVRPAPGSQAQSPAPRPAPRPVGAPRPAVAPRLVAARRQGGSHSRPSVVVNVGRPIGGGSGHAQNRNRIQKPY
ncbi:hypothetical protein KR084_006014 [Drosophila pseudotakahashii]|nr:hypothetical protein KR084_006014 [Drosophila pseudotakahashii]